MVGKYKVATLCSSTRFMDEFMETQKHLTLERNIVITIRLFGHSGDDKIWTDGTKETLNEYNISARLTWRMRFSSLTLSGYIGSSTRSERDGKIPSLHKKAKIKSSVSIQPFNIKDKEVKVITLTSFVLLKRSFNGIKF